MSSGLFSQQTAPQRRRDSGPRARAHNVRMSEVSYVHGASDLPLMGEPIFHNLRRTAAQHGNRDALVVPHQGYRATYGELVQQCQEVARGLMARGVAKGDRVGIWSPNRHEWVLVQYATAAIGAILVNINPAYRTSELEYALNQSGVSFLILAVGFRQADYREMLAAVKGRCPALREALVLEDGWEALKVTRILERSRVARKTFYAHFDDRNHCLRAAIEDLMWAMINTPEFTFKD